MTSPLNDPTLEKLLDRLHGQSDAQTDETNRYFQRRSREGTLPGVERFDDDMHRFFSDKLVALDRDKALLCYQLCRSLQATRVVEAGTSFGVSTLYLAAAVRDNGGEGDLRQTLRDVDGPVDFMLIDIWEVALDALERVAPHLRRGAIVACDNTTAFADYYRDYFEFVNDPASRFRTLTLPYPGGFELTVRV